MRRATIHAPWNWSVRSARGGRDRMILRPRSENRTRIKFGTLTFALVVFGSIGAAGEAVVRAGLLLDAPPFVTSPALEPSPESHPAAGFHPGIGHAWPASGRFGGRGHSDGVLDWDLPEFGVIEKGHLAAHPLSAARKPWAVRFAPADATGKATTTTGDYRVKWMSVEWRARFGAAEVRTTYSLASPGLLIETSERALRFALGATAGYRFAVLPLRAGPTVRALTPTEPAYDRRRDGDLADNWVLLWGGSAFPDVPILIVLKEQPAHLTAEFARDTPHAAAIMITSTRSLGYVVLATPYGMRALAPVDTVKTAQLSDGIARSRFWSKALLGFITDASEEFLIDEATASVAIRQRFVYRDLADAWGSRPLHLAPLPPVLALAAQVGPAIRLPVEAADLGFPTRHGPLHAVVGRDHCDYVMPIPPVFGRTPLASPEPSPAREAVRAHHMQRPHEGSRPPLPSEFPGLWSRRDRAIVDSTAWMNEIAFLWPQLDAASRRALRSNARSVLLDSLDDQERFRETELFQSIQRGSDRARGGLVSPIWFERTEPVTGTKYVLSYTVPNVRKEGRSVTDFPGSFTDCEWGNGLGLWGIYQLARVSGDWEVIRRNWALIARIYALFEVQQDWAAMTASGSERGRRWTDTSCYGGYIAFRELARRIGATEDGRKATYLHAKHAMLRLALLELGVWNYDLYGFKPYRVAHQMQEHNRGFNSQLEPMQYAVAADFRGEPIAVARRSFYSLVAEGTGYECPDLLYTLAPTVTVELVRAYRRYFPEWNLAPFVEALNTLHSPSGGITLYQMLLFQLRDPAIPTAKIRAQLAAAGGPEAIRQHLSKRGHYGRFGAAPEFVNMLLETRDDPAWLADWEGGDLLSADFKRTSNEASFEIDGNGAWRVILGGRAPVAVQWNGHPVQMGAAGWERQREHTMMRGLGPGRLEVRF
jgi:hypothetical protein